MATINQLVRQPRKRVVEKSDTCAAELPATSWRVHSRVHHHAEETELRTA